MGFFDRLFSSDPRAQLDKAEGLLAQGRPADALRLLERARGNGSLAQGNRHDSLVRAAKDALATAALEKAMLAEKSGFFEDAAEWIGVALENVDDEGQRAQLEAQAERLVGKAKEEQKAAGRIDFAPPVDPEDRDEPVPSGSELDSDSFYDALVDMLDDDIAERYERRPPEFRRAFVALNEGRALDARPALEELSEAHPDDPVYRLERGRSRLLTGEVEGARQDLEAVWTTFGDEPLDRAHSLSVPGMWAEAMLGADRADELIERLDEVAVPRDSDQNLCYHYALALMVTKRFDEALDYLAEAMDVFSHPDFPHQLAAVLHALGRTGEAIDTLERAIAPSCSPAGCRQVSKHVPSFQALAGLYLHQGHTSDPPRGGRRLDRVEQLLAHIAHAKNGRVDAEDYLLLAEYHKARGDAEAAEDATSKALELRSVSA